MTCIKKNAIYLVLTLSLLGTLGSLYFSDILGWAPCVLCWYQRIFLYPIVLIAIIAIIAKDTKAYSYILPFSILGLLTAFYHNLLYWGVIPENAGPCQSGISCTDPNLQVFGFITIPFLSLLLFIFITMLMCLYRNYQKSLVK